MAKTNDPIGYTASNPAYAETEGLLPQEPDARLKEERKFCSGIGWCFFIFIAVGTAIQYLIYFFILNYSPDLYYDHFDIAFLLAMLPYYAISYPLLAALSRQRKAVKFRQKQLGTANFLLLLPMCFGIVLVGNLLGLLVNALIDAIQGISSVDPISDVLYGNSIWINVLITVICAPIFEELAFRKILVSRIARFGEMPAIVVSGLMFGLSHGNFTQFFYAALLGMLFAYVYLKTGRIRYSIALHMTLNLSSTLSLAAITSFSAIADEITLIYDVLVCVLGIAGIILFILKRKKFILEPGVAWLPKGKRAAVIWGNPGMVAYTIGCIVLFVIAVFGV